MRTFLFLSGVRLDSEVEEDSSLKKRGTHNPHATQPRVSKVL